MAITDAAGAADNQLAVVRVRQNGQDNTAVTFCQVDDLAGTMNGLQPGQAGYAAAAQGNAYQFFFRRHGAERSGLRQLHAEPADGRRPWQLHRHVAHQLQQRPDLLDWEDVLGGGDHDFNDIIVQLDFTRASGSNLLV